MITVERYYVNEVVEDECNTRIGTVPGPFNYRNRAYRASVEQELANRISEAYDAPVVLVASAGDCVTCQGLGVDLWGDVPGSECPTCGGLAEHLAHPNPYVFSENQ